MEELKNQPIVENQENGAEQPNLTPEKEEAGVLGIIVSVIFPLIGIIIYFVKRKDVKNPGAYLWGACAGIVIGVILRAISGSL